MYSCSHFFWSATILTPICAWNFDHWVGSIIASWKISLIRGFSHSDQSPCQYQLNARSQCRFYEMFLQPNQSYRELYLHLKGLVGLWNKCWCLLGWMGYTWLWCLPLLWCWNCPIFEASSNFRRHWFGPLSACFHRWARPNGTMVGHTPFSLTPLGPQDYFFQ